MESPSEEEEEEEEVGDIPELGGDGMSERAFLRWKRSERGPGGEVGGGVSSRSWRMILTAGEVGSESVDGVDGGEGLLWRRMGVPSIGKGLW